MSLGGILNADASVPAVAVIVCVASIHHRGGKRLCEWLDSVVVLLVGIAGWVGLGSGDGN